MPLSEEHTPSKKPTRKHAGQGSQSNTYFLPVPLQCIFLRIVLQLKTILNVVKTPNLKLTKKEAQCFDLIDEDGNDANFHGFKYTVLIIPIVLSVPKKMQPARHLKCLL